MKQSSTTRSIRPAESGSVLIIILVAIALFAALSYAMLRDGGGAGTAARTMSDAQARLAATELMSLFRARAETYQKLRIMNGCTAEQIHMGTGLGSGGLPLMPLADERCHMESKQGGGLSPLMIPKAFYIGDVQTVYHRMPRLVSIAPAQAPFVNGLGKQDEPDWQTHYNYIRREICEAYNRMVGIEGIPVEEEFAIGFVAEILRGHRTACRAVNPDMDNYQIYYVHHVN